VGEDALELFSAELIKLRVLAGNPPYKEIVHQARRQRPPVALSTSTLSGWFQGRAAPDAGPPINFLLGYLHGRASTRADLPPVSWYEVLRREASAQTHTARGGRPRKVGAQRRGGQHWDAPRGVGTLQRVRDSDPFHLGVHRPIRVRGADLDDSLTPYIRRDADSTILQRIAAAVGVGGFVVLVGGSSVGKTRSLYEAVLETVPQWSLLQPESAEDLALVAVSPPRHLVVWLDELQNYLNGVTASTVRALLRAGAIIVGTLWPRYHAVLTVPPSGGGLEGDPYRSEREVLKLARVVHLPGEFNEGERLRARKAANEDARLQTALANAQFGSELPLPAPARSSSRKADPRRSEISFKYSQAAVDSGRMDPRQMRAVRLLYGKRDEELRLLEGTQFGLTQTIAAAPQLVERWRDADPEESPYAHAVLAAAIDAVRLGVRAPLTEDLLRAAAPGYCTSAQRARAATQIWFEDALEYATQPLLGATAALIPVVPVSVPGAQRHFRVADFLLQFVSAERAQICPPALFWQACAEHLTDASDLERVGLSAIDRLRYGDAIPLIRRAVTGGKTGELPWLDTILFRQGRIDEAIAVHRACRDSGIAIGEAPAAHLAQFLIDEDRAQDALEELRTYTEDKPLSLVPLLRAKALNKAGAVDKLQTRASAGDVYAALELADSRVRDAEEVLAAAKREVAPDEADLLDDNEWSVRIESAPDTAAERLLEAFDQVITQLEQRNRFAAQLPPPLRPPADTPDDPAELVEKLRSSPRSRDDVWKLAELLMKQGKNDEAFAFLRDCVQDGDHSTALWLSELLAAHGRQDEALELLRSRVAANDPAAFIWLDYLLAERGETAELLARAQAGDPVAVEMAFYATADRLTREGRFEDAFTVLRRLIDAGNHYMARGELSEWLTKHGLTDEARRLDAYGLTADGALADDH
jgi:tetratricopeptide (TPR) repeat protein